MTRHQMTDFRPIQSLAHLSIASSHSFFRNDQSNNEKLTPDYMQGKYDSSAVLPYLRFLERGRET